MVEITPIRTLASSLYSNADIIWRLIFAEYVLHWLSCVMPLVLWRCWLGGRKGIWPVKNWVVGCWRGYLSAARCRLAYDLKVIRLLQELSNAIRRLRAAFRTVSTDTLSYRVSGSTLTAVGRSQLLAWRPGTHSWILSGIQQATQTVLGVYSKRTCSRFTSASSALGVLNDFAPYKSTHSLTHSICAA